MRINKDILWHITAKGKEKTPYPEKHNKKAHVIAAL